jgi:hypothetical protein
VEMAVREWLQMHENDLCCGGIFKHMPTQKKCFECSGIMLKNIDISQEYSIYI